MKKLLPVLALSFLMVNSYAQTTNRSGNTQYSSSNSSSSYASSQAKSSSTSGSRSSSTTYSANHSSNYSSKGNSFNDNHESTKFSRYTMYQNPSYKKYNFDYTTVVFKYHFKDENSGENELADKKNEARLVSTDQYVDYIDRNKISPTENENNGDNSNSNANDSSSTTNTAPKYIPSDNSGRIINCSQFSEMNTQQRNLVLGSLELYDLTDIVNCSTFNTNINLNTDNRFMITCDIFINSTEQGKEHIIKYPQFYNIELLVNCPEYLEFIKK